MGSSHRGLLSEQGCFSLPPGLTEAELVARRRITGSKLARAICVRCFDTTRLSSAQLRKLETLEPRIAAAFHKAMAVSLSRRLSDTNELLQKVL